MIINLGLCIMFCVLLMGSFVSSTCSSSNFHRFPKSPLVLLFWLFRYVLVYASKTKICVRHF